MRFPTPAAAIGVLLIAAFLFAPAAQAAPIVGPLGALVESLDPEEDVGEDEDEAGDSDSEEECEEAEDEEDGECAALASAEEAVEECLLSSATATVSALPSRNKVRLSVRYTASSPAVVSVDYALRGARGRLKIDQETKHFSRRGVFRDTETLTPAQMARVRTAKAFDVGIHAVNTPRYCHRLFDRELSARRAAHGTLTWSSPPARRAPR